MATKDDTAALKAVYEECRGAWTGCDWTANHGRWDIDIDGGDPAKLREAANILRDGTDEQREAVWGWPIVKQIPDRDEDEMTARDYREAAAEDLESAAEWLETVAKDAADAEMYGEEAMEHIKAGRMGEALESAEQACSRENTYGDDPVWGQFRRAIEDILDRDE